MSRTEQQMEEELKGIAAPADDMPMEDEATMGSELTVDTMMSNYETMEPTEQEAIRTLLNEPISQLFDRLTGQTVISEFSSQLTTAPATPAEAPAGEGMMAPEEPMPAMAQGGMLNTQLRDMMQKDMSPQEIRSQIR
jgi:hypothetical protein